FQPQAGSLWEFEKQGVVKRTADGKWEKGPNSTGFELRGDFINFLNRLTMLSEAFFGSKSGPTPKITARVTSTPGLNIERFTIGGETGERKGPDTEFPWPGKNPDEGVRLVANSAPFVFSGLWGLYRMIERADDHDPANKRVTLSRVRAEGGNASAL